jgi:peptide/nickel transport system ATP-binding protein
VIIGRPPDLIDPPPGCKFAPRCPYARERCTVEEPLLTEVGVRGHRFACHFPLGTAENAANLQANIAAGLPQALALIASEGDGSIDLPRLLAVDSTAEAMSGSGGDDSQTA